MAQGTTELFFHVLRQPTTLYTLSAEIYGDTARLAARDFRELNARVADSKGRLEAGQLVFLPDAACHHPDQRDVIIETLIAVNNAVLTQMTAAERRTLADSYDFLDNTTSHPDLFHLGLTRTASTASTVSAVVALEIRLLGDVLKDLENRYVETFRHHGRMTPEFFRYRQGVYRMLDSHMGRVVSALSTQTPFAAPARRRFNIHTRSQIKYWNRNGTTEGVRDFKRHFGNIHRVHGWVRGGGYLALGIGGVLTYQNIAHACEVGDEEDCLRETVVQGTEFGSVAGGAALGAKVGYLACNAVFGVPSSGTSLLWCGLVAGTAGSVGGGLGGGWLGRLGGTMLYEQFFR